MQKFRITDLGILQLFRRGEWVDSFCPYFDNAGVGLNGQRMPCLDNCPHFGEVEDQGRQQRLEFTCGNGVELYNMNEED